MTPQILRGEIYQAELSPTQGSEQSGTRPVIVISRDALNAVSTVVIVVPVTGRENKRRIYPSQLEIRARDGGLTKDSVALCEQTRAISKTRLKKRLGILSNRTIALLNSTLKITLDLP
jgi:mRNA interferase MazF